MILFLLSLNCLCIRKRLSYAVSYIIYVCYQLFCFSRSLVSLPSFKGGLGFQGILFFRYIICFCFLGFVWCILTHVFIQGGLLMLWSCAFFLKPVSNVVTSLSSAGFSVLNGLTSCLKQNLFPDFVCLRYFWYWVRLITFFLVGARWFCQFGGVMGCQCFCFVFFI